MGDAGAIRSDTGRTRGRSAARIAQENPDTGRTLRRRRWGVRGLVPIWDPGVGPVERPERAPEVVVPLGAWD